ncbi:PCMD domain-containing protein [Myroides sp. LJL115]
MKIKYFFYTIITFIAISMVSCIKSEALNNEADILEAQIDPAQEKLQSQLTNNEVTFFINDSADITKMAPAFKITTGATISPASGSVQDFTHPINYIVTSESGNYTKSYKVSMFKAELQGKYSFEKPKLFSNGGFYEWFETEQINLDSSQEEASVKLWDSGNSGFFLSFLMDPDKRPNADEMITTIEPNGKIGKGIRMSTQVTGEFGQQFAPIAAGNIFTGVFSTNIFNPIESPRFGIPYTQKEEPTLMTGYYKYQPGEEFVVHASDGKTNLTQDTFDAYAVFFEKTKANDYLRATHNFRFIENPMDDPRIISYARINPEDRQITQEWTYFELDFHRILDRKMEEGKQYMIAIVFTSSLEGDKYNGAIGSTLCIDEIEILTVQSNSVKSL